MNDDIRPLFCDARANEREVGDAVNIFLFCRPTDAPENEHAEKRIVEGPSVMTRNAADNAAFLPFESPQFGSRRAVFDGRSNYV